MQLNLVLTRPLLIGNYESKEMLYFRQQYEFVHEFVKTLYSLNARLS